nr:hypothetical protein [Tanacetum cinerariifolium]
MVIVVLVVAWVCYIGNEARLFVSQGGWGWEGCKGEALFDGRQVGRALPTICRAHEIHSPTSANVENLNDTNVEVEMMMKGYEFRTFFIPAGNGVDVVILEKSIRAISERFAHTAYGFFLRKRVKLHGVPMTAFSENGLSAIATKLGTPLMLNSYTFDMCIQSYSKSSYARALIEVGTDVELKDNIMVAMPKRFREGLYTCNVRVEYEWKHPRCACLGFKPVKQVYRHVSKKNNAKTSGNKKKNMDPTIEVSNLNPFDVLNSIKYVVDLGRNGGTSNLASKKANSSGSSFWNVESSSTSTTLIVEKIDKMKRLIIEGKVTLVDNEGKPLTKVDSSNDYDSEDKVASCLK